MNDYRDRDGVTGGVKHAAHKPAAKALTAAPAAAASNTPIQILPVGRYWVTAFAEKQTELDAFFKIMGAAGSTQTEVTEHIGDPGTAAAKQGSFYIFNVKTPVAWPVGVFGKPTIAGSNIHSMADTVQAPDLPLDPSTSLGNFLGDLGKLFSGTGGIIAAGLVVWCITEGGRGRR